MFSLKMHFVGKCLLKLSRANFKIFRVFVMLMCGWLLPKGTADIFLLHFVCKLHKNMSERHRVCFTSISQRALELVAEVADCRSVVLRKTCCCFLYSSQVRNFSCSA